MIRGSTHPTLNGPTSLPNAALRNPAAGKTQSPAPQAPSALGHQNGPVSPTTHGRDAQSLSQQAAVQGKISTRTGQPTAPNRIASPRPVRQGDSAPAAPSLSPRRDSHTDHPVAMPGGRERGSGGGSGQSAGHGRQGFDGRSDMHSWMPVSAQMSPLSRLPRTAMAPAHALRAFHPIGRLHFPMAAIGFAFDLVSSIFRRSPAHAHADRRDHRDASHERAQEKRQRVRQHHQEEHVDVHAYRNDTRQADSTRRVFAENPGGGKRGPVQDPSRNTHSASAAVPSRRQDNSPLLA